MEPIIDFFSTYVDVTLALLIVVSSFWVKKWISPVAPQLPVFKKLSMSHIIFLWSLLLMALYFLILKHTGQVKEAWSKYAITYFFSTSFYELTFAPLQTLAEKYFGNDKTTTNDTH